MLLSLNADLINKTESPALSRFAPTKRLHPVVRRWRFGWPERNIKERKSQTKGPKISWIFFMQELRRPSQTVSDPTTINVTECPHVIMQISNDKLLIRRLHWVILGVENMGMSWSWKRK